MPSVATYLWTLLAAYLVYGLYRYARALKQRWDLWAAFDRTPGAGPLAPIPRHPLLGQVYYWVDRQDREHGLGLRVSKLEGWAKTCLEGVDDGKVVKGVPNKFMRMQFLSEWIPLGPGQYLFPLDADVVKDMLNSTAESGVEKGDAYNLVARLIKGGILQLPMNEKWKHQRRLTENAFRLENLKFSHKQIAKVVSRVLERWQARHDAWRARIARGEATESEKIPGDPKKRAADGWLDIRPEMLRITMDVICQVGFGKDFEAGSDREALMKDEREIFQAESLKKVLDPADPDQEPGEPLYRTFNKILTSASQRDRRLPIIGYFSDEQTAVRNRYDLLDKVVGDMVDARLAKVARGDRSRDGTLLDAIADVGEDGNPIMSRHQAMIELKTLLFAGHDTSGNALTWAAYHLATNKDVLAKLRHEVDHVLPMKTSYSDLERAQYLNNFIKEILRLHPSAGFTRRVFAENGVTLGGVHLPKGSEIMFIPPLIHKQERYFERALEFLPERWDEGSPLKMDSRAYFPFSLGPRNCVGMKLANLELRCILVETVRRWDFEYDSTQGEPITYLGMTLDSGAIHLRLRPRTDKDAGMWRGVPVELMEA
ncbi:cytochrome P450 [Hyaloraphidium curvatum]|nr:cytochrome P450 [Hyaloraphidium curvatum]